MKKVLPIAPVTMALALAGCQNMDAAMPWINMGNQVAKSAGYDADARVAAGIKDALNVGTDNATQQLSMQGAFHLQLPQAAQPMANTLRQLGMGSYVDKLETAMNRGAEQAAAQAKPVFKQAIATMTVTDAVGIVRGGNTAATDYFRQQTEPTLRQRYQPIIESSLQKTGFYDQYKAMLGVYDKLPLTNKPNLDLENYVLDQSMNKLFTRIGQQETLIRKNPMQQGSALIGAVFGSQSQPAQ
ncbi:MAG: DUF4197 domain-containing protein [Alcanivorax sp.]|nr:DUF4197 domain-containing protein [Alcanivorax sp.]